MAGKKAKAKSAKKEPKKRKKSEIKLGSKELENKRHEIFCRLYAGIHGMSFFGNGTRCYMQAFGFNEEVKKLRESVDQIAAKKERGYTTKVQMVLLRIRSKEKVASVMASELLANLSISPRIDYLMENMFDDNFADRELGFVIGQRHDLPSKVSAIRHYDDKKGRITKHMDITTDGEPIDGIQIVTPAVAAKK